MSSASNGKPNAPNRQAKVGSPKLGQTLQDLESALADWDALSESAQTADATADTSSDNVASTNTTTSSAASAKDAELRKKTKKLLDQLRQQLADLAE